MVNPTYNPNLSSAALGTLMHPKIGIVWSFFKYYHQLSQVSLAQPKIDVMVIFSKLPSAVQYSGLSTVNGPFGQQGPAATPQQRCPSLTQNRCRAFPLDLP